MREETARVEAPSSDIVGTLRAWAIQKALPLWAEAGFDRVRGGFQERLNSDGTPDMTAPRRLRVQARQIYVYAHAAVLGWYPAGRDLAVQGVDFMVANYRAPDRRPGYVSTLALDRTVNPRRDTYDHMFVLLALAWASRATGDAQVRTLLDETLAFVDEHLTASDGSLVEGIPASSPRRQNPHMHAFEAMLALHETVAHPEAMARAGRLLGMLERRFFARETRTLGEYFADDWSPALGADGATVEPGHQAEWSWLLRRYERLNSLPWGSLATTLLDSALRWTDQAGFLIDEADRSGTARRTTRRTWPQTELAKAWIGEVEAGRQGAADKARMALEGLAAHYLDRPVVGGWTDQFDAAARPLSAYIPASTFYHVFCAIAEADRVLGVQRS